MAQTLKMKVDNTGFLLDRLGRDCAPLQYVRELTQNAIEAIVRAGRNDGQITWEASVHPGPVPKLSIVDNGEGMTGDEMIRYINTLSSSGSRQALDGNYGVGAKIAAATRNPAGLLYLSWKHGRPEGEAVQLVRDSNGQYGLLSFQDGGDYNFIASAPEELKPAVIRRASAGTRIVLMGESEDHDTCAPPADSGTHAAQWVRRYLNTRYFRLPRGIRIQCQDWSPRGDGGLRPVTGQGPMLDAVAVARGTVPLDGALAHWWIVPPSDAKFEKAVSLPGVGKHATNMQTFGTGYQTRGHVAFLHRNELYDFCTAKAACARLQQAGIIFGAERVVLYFEPTHEDILTNTPRTSLLIGSEAPPWTDWANQFREAMPQELRDFIDTFEKKRAPRDDAAIRDRIKEVLHLFPVPKYVRKPDGHSELDDQDAFGARKESSARTSDGTAPGSCSPSPRRPRAARGLKPQGPRGDRASDKDLPRTHWKYAGDRSRAPGEMEDKAATYDAATNTLFINGDFRGFIAWIDFFAAQYPSVAGVREEVKRQVELWWVQALLEAVIAHREYSLSPHWSGMRELSEEALTTAVLPRYHLFNALKRGIRTTLGQPEVNVVAPPSVAEPPPPVGE